VPQTCHDLGATAVIDSHSKTPQTASELGTSRSALTVKCPPKQPVIFATWVLSRDLPTPNDPLMQRHPSP
jgi:hypothetical protein